MLNILVLEISLLFLSDDSKEEGWICSLHSDSNEGDDGDNYGVKNFIGMTTWKIRFLDGDIEVGMMLLP